MQKCTGFLGEMKIIGYTAVTFAIVIYSSILNGWALSKLWEWFIEPTFGLAALSIPAAIGLGYVVSYLTHQSKEGDSEGTYGEKLVKGVVVGTLKPLFSLAFGFIVASFM